MNTQFYVLTALAIVGFATMCYIVIQVTTGYVVTQNDEDSKHLDDFDLEGPNTYDNAALFKAEIPRLAKRIAAAARMELYLTERSEEQVIQAREWMVRELKSMSVRKVDILKIIPIATQLAFLETRYERQARLMTMSPRFIQREVETSTTLWTYLKPSWRRPFGQIVREDKPKKA